MRIVELQASCCPNGPQAVGGIEVGGGGCPICRLSPARPFGRLGSPLERKMAKILGRDQNGCMTAIYSAEKICMTQSAPAAKIIRHLLGVLGMGVLACGFSGCWVRCSMPLNAPPYDPNQCGWGHPPYRVVENSTRWPKINPCWRPSPVMLPCRPSGCCPTPPPFCPTMCPRPWSGPPICAGPVYGGAVYGGPVYGGSVYGGPVSSGPMGPPAPYAAVPVVPSR